MASSSKDLRAFVAERFDTIAREPSAFQEFTGGIGDARAPSRILAREAVLGARDVLDVGCGPAVFFDTLHDSPAWEGTYVGADTSAAMIDHAVRRLGASRRYAADRCHLVTMPLVDERTRLAWNDCSFDAVVCRHVLEHLSHPLPLLHELARVCRSTLVLVFSQAPLQFQAEGIRIADQQLGVPRFAHRASDLLPVLDDWTVTMRRHDPRDKLSPTGGGLLAREALWVARR